MYSNGRRSSTNPVRISMSEREDRNLRNDQRPMMSRNEQRPITSRNDLQRSSVSKHDQRPSTSKHDQRPSISKMASDALHVPRARFRSSSCDRTGSIGRKLSYVKPAGKTLLRLPTTPVMSTRAIIKHNSGLTTSSSRPHALSQTTRSSSADRASNVGAKGPKKDTRPLIDKNYQMTLLNKIDNFFQVNECSSLLNSSGSLKPITLKMFVEVSNHLLICLDIKHDITIKNYVEELPKYAKKLHYPGTMTKSWLKTANAMHSWPYVLGWIGWLVEACQVREIALDMFKLETLPFTGMEQEALSSKTEFLMLLECYKAWNDEKHEEETELLQKCLQNVLIHKNIPTVTPEDLIQAENELEEETRKLEIMDKESEQLDEKIAHLRKKLSSLKAKENKQVNDIKTEEEYIKKISDETNQLNAECKVLNDKLKMGKVQYEELISVVRNQPMSMREKKNILKKCTEIQNYMHEFDKHLMDYEKELYTLDIKLASFSNNFSKAVLAYNKEVFLNFPDNDVGVNFDELKLPEKGLLDPQMLDVMKEKAVLMQTFKEFMMEQCTQLQPVIDSDALKLERLQEEMKSLQDEIKFQQGKPRVVKMKARMTKQKADLLKQIDALKIKIKDIQDAMPDIEVVDREIEEATEKLDAVTRRNTFLKESAKRFFGEFYKILGDHRSELHDLLSKHKESQNLSKP